MDLGIKPGTTPGGQLAGDAADIVKDVTTATFAKDVLEASRKVPVLVDFWASWCEPCKQLTPVLEKVVKSFGGRVRLAKVNVDQNQTLAGQLQIRSIPTVYAFRDGRPLDGFQGAQPEGSVRAFVERLLGEEAALDAAAAIAAADEALEAGDPYGAAEVYAAVLQGDPQNAPALAGLAKCYLKSGDVARAEQTLELVPPDKRDSGPVAGVRAALDLAKVAGKAGDTANLKAKVDADPGDHQARLDYAIALAAAGQKAEAAEQLLESFRRDRKWNDEAARKQLVKLFDAWGPKDPATLDGRRRLSSLMFA
jgi:putative thioredoxin